MTDALRNKRNTKIGFVVSDAMNKTIVVQIETLNRHAMYGKYVRKSSKFYAHDENNECQTGDKVEIMETRPLSKKKRWRYVRTIEKAVLGEEEQEGVK